MGREDGHEGDEIARAVLINSPTSRTKEKGPSRYLLASSYETKVINLEKIEDKVRISSNEPNMHFIGLSFVGPVEGGQETRELEPPFKKGAMTSLGDGGAYSITRIVQAKEK